MGKMSEEKHVLYAGYDDKCGGSTAFHRMEALADLPNFHVTSVNSEPLLNRKLNMLFPMRVLRKLFRIHYDFGHLSYRLAYHMMRHKKLDLMWLDKGLHVEPWVFSLLRRLHPKAKIIGYAPDDMMNPANQTKTFVKSLPYYDLFFTTKSYNVKELEDLGCRRAHFIGNAYHRPLHKPLKLAESERNAYGDDVVFIGAWEKERARDISYLAEHGIRVRVWGPWPKEKSSSPTLRIEGEPIFAEEYTKGLNAGKISLCFLRKQNRDLQTQRTIEIPACGAFMLAERSSEHMSLFEEGKEAEFFSSKEELLRKVIFYLENDEKREAIAKAGLQRCLDSGYSNHARMEEMLRVAFQ